MKTALITGATSGIGEAIAYAFARGNYNIVLSGRRTEKLNVVANILKDKFEVDVLTLKLDVRNKGEVIEAIDNIPEPFNNIDVLVNNAGLAVGLNTVAEGVIDDWERMIDTNFKGLLYVTRQILPQMIARNEGHIINIGSIAGKEVYKNGNVYCATKHAVDALTKALRMELVSNNVKVTQIAPGAVETEFSMVRFKGDKEKANQVYQGYKPLSASDVAEAVWYAASTPAHVNINDLVIMPTAQANASVFYKVDS